MRNFTFSPEVPSCAINLHELAVSYLSFRKDELDKRDHDNIRKTFELAADFYPNSSTDDWDAEVLEAFQKFLNEHYTITGIKKHINFFRQVFNWGMRKHLVSSVVCFELSQVPPLRPDRCRKNPKRTVINRRVFESQLKYYPRVIADMMQMQLLTGMRPNEVCQVNLSEIDKTLFSDRWIYAPQLHKTAWRGKERNILFGQSVREIIDRNASQWRDAVFVSVKKRKPYTEPNYARTISKIQKKYSLQKFVPYQLRHTAFTEVAAEFGIELADVFVGHCTKGIAAVYDHSELERQWFVVSRRQGSFQNERSPEGRPTLRIFNGE